MNKTSYEPFTHRLTINGTDVIVPASLGIKKCLLHKDRITMPTQSLIALLSQLNAFEEAYTSILADEE